MDFKEDTGYSPSNIYVVMSSTCAIGEEYEYYIEEVSTTIKI